MKKLILILSLCLGVFTLFFPNYVAADYSQDLDTCNKILSKSSSNEYCTLYIDAIFGDRVTGPMVVITNVYIHPKSGVVQAKKFLEEEYKSTFNWLRDSSDQRPGFEKYMKVIEEVGPDNMKFLIRQSADEGFHTAGPNVVYTFSSYLFMQQGECVIVVNGDAGKGYIKNQNSIYNDDVSGDVETLKKESIVYMNKVGNDLAKNCKKEIIKTETPVALALIDESPKASDFLKVATSDFKLVYPISTDTASLKSATSSSNITGKTFVGKVGDKGKLLIELPKGEAVTLTDNQTGAEIGEAHVIWEHNAELLNHRFTYHISEVDCHIQIAQSVKRQEEFERLGFVRLGRQTIDPERLTKTVGDCSDLDINGLMRIFVQKGPAVLNTQNGSVLADQDADFGIFNDVNTGMSKVEIYNGSITVSSKSGQAKSISSVYGSEIKQIEVNNEGVMTEKTAIPQSQWEAFSANNQQKETQSKTAGSPLPVLAVIFVLGMGGIVFFLYRRGILVSLYKTLE